MKDYSEYLASPEWKARRLKRISLSNSCCEACGERANLDVHHLTYEHIFDEPLEDLMTLCRLHHELVEALIADGRLSRKGKSGLLRLRTREALIPFITSAKASSVKSKGRASDFRDSLLRDEGFLRILRESPNRGLFKRALRRKYKKSDPDFKRIMVNGMILWNGRKEA